MEFNAAFGTGRYMSLELFNFSINLSEVDPYMCVETVKNSKAIRLSNKGFTCLHNAAVR